MLIVSSKGNVTPWQGSAGSFTESQMETFTFRMIFSFQCSVQLKIPGSDKVRDLRQRLHFTGASSRCPTARCSASSHSLGQILPNTRPIYIKTPESARDYLLNHFGM